MKKVFISSVIHDFDNERKVAESAVKSLGLIPIMSEQFDAQPLSPRQTCLDGIQKSDLFVAILGNRYGTKQVLGNLNAKRNLMKPDRLDYQFLYS